MAELGYRMALLFDHRLAVVGTPPAMSIGAPEFPAALSRLRLDSDAPVERLRAIVSGAHPALFRVGFAPLGFEHRRMSPTSSDA
jgi:hypothetical protein